MYTVLCLLVGILLGNVSIQRSLMLDTIPIYVYSLITLMGLFLCCICGFRLFGLFLCFLGSYAILVHENPVDYVPVAVRYMG